MIDIQDRRRVAQQYTVNLTCITTVDAIKNFNNLVIGFSVMETWCGDSKIENQSYTVNGYHFSTQKSHITIFGAFVKLPRNQFLGNSSRIISNLYCGIEAKCSVITLFSNSVAIYFQSGLIIFITNSIGSVLADMVTRMLSQLFDELNQ